MELFSALMPSVVIIFMTIVLIAAAKLILSLYRIVPPDVAMIISGRGRGGYRYVVGGGTFVVPVIENVKTMQTGLRTLPVNVARVLTNDNVPITVDAVIQTKIGSDDESIRAAASRFLAKSPTEIDQALHSTLGGHLRAIIARLSAIECYQNREAFAQEVYNLSAPDLARMGFTIDSFTITEINDEGGYYRNLGQGVLSRVDRDAKVAIAEAERETREKQAAASLAAKQAEINAETRTAEAARDRDIKTAEFRRTTETAKADAEMAFPLRQAAIHQELAKAEGAAEVERQRQAAASATEALKVAEQRQRAEIIIPANAAREAAIQAAQAESETQKLHAAGLAEATRLQAEADAGRIRQTRTAEADGVKAEGLARAEAEKASLLARAEGERELAEALSAQGEVNLRQTIALKAIEARVEIAANTARLMGQVGANTKIVQMGGSGNSGKTGNALIDLVTQMPELAAIIDGKSEALHGMALTDLFNQVKNLLPTKVTSSNENTTALIDEPSIVASEEAKE